MKLIGKKWKQWENNLRKQLHTSTQAYGTTAIQSTENLSECVCEHTPSQTDPHLSIRI